MILVLFLSFEHFKKQVKLFVYIHTDHPNRKKPSLKSFRKWCQKHHFTKEDFQIFTIYPMMNIKEACDVTSPLLDT